MANTVNYKYVLHQHVYTIQEKSTPFYPKCPTCLGEGKLIRTDGTEITCPVCNGNKTITNWGVKYEVQKDIVDRITIYIENDDGFNSYGMKGSSDDLAEEDVFFSMEDAQKECDKLNKLNN